MKTPETVAEGFGLSVTDILEDMHSHQIAWGQGLVSMGVSGVSDAFWNAQAQRLGSVGEFVSREETLRKADDVRDVYPLVRTALTVLAATDVQDQAYWAHELKSWDRFEAVTQAAFATSFEMTDWRVAGGDIDGDEASTIRGALIRSEDRIDIALDDGRSVWIETQGDDLRVMVFNQTKDEPILIKAPISGEIVVDGSDYREGAVLEDDEYDTPEA